MNAHQLPSAARTAGHDLAVEGRPHGQAPSRCQTPVLKDAVT